MTTQLDFERDTRANQDRLGAVLSPASFWWPERIVRSAWLEHAPFAFWLTEAVRPAVLVELGTGDGFSYTTWCQAVERLGLATRCCAVAHRVSEGPYVRESAEDDYRALSAYNDEHYASFSTLIQSTFDEAREHFSDGTIDLLHIDGVGDYEGARRVFEGWLPKLSPAGVVLLHGCNVRDQGSGVWRLWDEVSVRYPSFCFLHGRGLGIVAVGPAVPDALRALLHAPAADAATIRDAYARLGRCVAIRQSHDDLATVSGEREQTIQELQHVMSSKDREQENTARKLANVMGELAEAKGELEQAKQRLKEVGADNAACRTRIAALSDDIERESATLRAVTEQLHRANHDVHALRTSTSWRITAPVRALVTSVPVSRGAVSRARNLSTIVRNSVRTDGWGVTLRKIAAAPKRHGLRKLLGAAAGGRAALSPTFRLPSASPALETLVPRVLIIAETSIPQCLKYRVTQKQQMIKDLGVDCTVVSWADIQACRDLLPSHSIAFFYRVPGFPEPLEIIAEAKAQGLVTFWEVDDLIFDAEKYILNSNLTDLSLDVKKGVLSGVPLYRAAMLACDYAIASTTGLAEAMLDAGVKQAFVVENALDGETMRIASRINERRRASDGIVRIGYGSGTKTHDADFRVAAAAIKRVLRARPDVRLTVIGELNLPADYAEVRTQVERLPLSDYPTYLKRLAECDISIAPLEDSIFNDAKSNIKYLEASVIRLPSVCSPSAAFRTAIRDGETGYLAEDPDAWERALLALIDDASLRGRIADRAYDHVTTHYAPHTVAVEQVAPILEPYRRAQLRPRVLGVNVYFEPRSFGGATVVAEEVARRLNQRGDIEYFMFTTLPTTDVSSYRLVRYAAEAAGVFAMGLPHENDPSMGFENPHSVKAFAEAVHALRPDVVHLHSIQGIGAQIAEVCRTERIPFVVTLHDAWWICGRQFMVTGKNQYCGQTKIDVNVCARCVDDASLNTYRQFRLREILLSAALLIAPSEFFRRLYVANGFDAEKIVVNKNGILPPSARVDRPPTRGRPLRFGYVGGETPIKGAHLIKKAFRSLPQKNYELHVVDNALNLGLSTIHTSEWQVPGTLKIVPAYTRDTIDDFFNGLDVLLFPTQWKESFGLSVREALIRDVWVITTDAGGVIEDIVPGENGEIIPLDDDGTALASAIGRLLDQPARLDGYRNPHAGQVRLFDQQADELAAMLAGVMSSAAADRSDQPLLAAS
ncbi:glycosyltransferase [Paraburkholderia caballeronis]|uniref:glycosyltransferase n=1 Tax=Paraburkholderia caballeronis TaxID=416943 RepID=UPI0010652A97|nr:glycosyltransferase [Paraburkholderia caballeronis]TDV14424.1 glycosyltransferase involved in cell wall biosynthesis [Paraburkholderia caballeronis]TDV15950.1 glycosyltransferase involved in cell wall biosynthesis [Paraburkholderia caballeronis]TDV25211.1 glycosyltransferase involved in cell wall biosynthesis [Paraburkholderia caballeronis]